jgi:hypothetical protein
LIKIIRSITEGVDGCNKAGGIGYNAANAPGIVGVSCNGLSILANDCDYVALQILDEVVGNIVINNSAYGLALSITCIYIISFLNRKVNKKLRTSKRSAEKAQK